LSSMKRSEMSMAWIVLGILTLGFLISKEILVFNEETLVLVSFVAFVVVITTYTRDMVIEELEGRAQQIRKDFDYFLALRAEVLATLINYHRKQTTLFEEIVSIFEFSQREIQKILTLRQRSFEHQLTAQMEQKLARIAANESKVVQEVQLETAELFTAAMLEHFSNDNDPAVQAAKEEYLQDGIELLEELEGQNIVDAGDEEYFTSSAAMGMSTSAA